MNTIPTIWQKSLVWVPYINWFFVFVRMLGSLRKKPVWKSYLKECVLMTLSWAVLAVPVNLLELLIPWALRGLILLMAWFFPIIYVHASIRLEESI